MFSFSAQKKDEIQENSEPDTNTDVENSSSASSQQTQSESSTKAAAQTPNQSDGLGPDESSTPTPTDEKSEESVSAEQQETDASATSSSPEPEQQEIQNIDSPEEGAELNIIELLNFIIREGLAAKTSDVHLEPGEKRMVVRFRIDGILRDVLTINKDLVEPLVFRIKVASKLRTDEHFAPQDGRIRFVIGDDKVDTRISILPTTNGEKVVIRLLAKGDAYSLEKLGFTDAELEKVRKSYMMPYGMILSVGPTGSGKTTTLYSILKIVNSRDVNITTVEDPVEHDVDGINNVQINNKANLTFATGLRAILRQDPDVIMLGEIRDAETASIATNAALTGHLVLSTLHTNDAISTIPRLIDMGVEPFLVSSTLNLIMAQRLARRLCEHCKIQYDMPQEEHDKLKKMRRDIAELVKVGDTIYKESGCEECGHSGFSGRVGLYEVLGVTQRMKRMISEREHIEEIFKVAREEGLELMVENGVGKTRTGLTSISELLRVTALIE